MSIEGERIPKLVRAIEEVFFCFLEQHIEYLRFYKVNIIQNFNNLSKNFASLFFPIALGLLIAVITTFTINEFSPKYLVAGLCGLIVIIPTFVIKEIKRYWLFLLVVSLLINISKNLTKGLALHENYLNVYGVPSSGIIGISIFASDVVLFVLVVSWLFRLSTRKEKLYFPKVSFLFLGFFVWAAFVSVAKSVSFYYSLFELVRLAVYFLTFLYIANNVNSKKLVKGIMFTLMFCLFVEGVVSVGSFLTQKQLDLFSGLYQKSTDNVIIQGPVPFALQTESGKVVKEEKNFKRASGTFTGPIETAFYFELLVPMALVLMMVSASFKMRLFYFILFSLGVAGTILTFSRSGFVAMAMGIFATIWLAGKRNLYSKKTKFVIVALMVASILAISPKIYKLLTLRPEAFLFRFELLEEGFDMIIENPISGVGLSNSAAANPKFHPKRDRSGKGWDHTAFHNQYLIVVVDTGIVGLILYFSFFGIILFRTYRCALSKDKDVSYFSIGIFGALFSIAVHLNGDGLGSRVVNTMVWIYAGTIMALYRVELEKRLFNRSDQRARA